MFDPSHIDALKINFSPEKLEFMNFILGFIMFGVALELRIKDFQNIINHPKSIAVGLLSQLILLPIFTVIVIYLFKLPESMAMGMILVAACPGGNVSNYFTHKAKGNTALSISMTSIVTLFSIVITPLSFFIFTGILGLKGTRDSFSIDFISMFLILLKLIVIPLTLGMAIKHYRNNWAEKLVKVIKPLSLLLLIGIIIVSLKANITNLYDYLKYIFLLVLVHNGLAYVLGYYTGRIFKENIENSKAIAMETGIQNAGLALILALNFFDGLGGMVLVAGWWGVWDILSGFLLALYWSKNDFLRKPS